MLLRRSVLGLAGLLGGLGLGLTMSACGSRPEERPAVTAAALRVWPIGCATIDRAARCEVKRDGVLRLRIEGESVSGDKVEVLQGGQSLLFAPVPVEQGWIGTVQVTDRAKALTVRATLPGGTVEQTVELWPRQGASWLALAQEQLNSNHVAEARQIVEEHQQEWQGSQAEGAAHGLDAMDWTRAALLWGNLAWDEEGHQKAEEWFTKASQRANQAGLPRDELESALWLDTILLQERHDLNASRRLLEQLNERAEQAWEQRPWLLFHWGEWARRSGRLGEALDRLDQGLQAARWLGDKESELTAHILRARLDEQLGRYVEADEEHEEAATLLKNLPEQHCRRADELETRIEWFLGRREHERHQPSKWRMPSVAAPLAGGASDRTLNDADDPKALFQEAVHIRETLCTQSRPRAMQALLGAQMAMLYDAGEKEVEHKFAHARDLANHLQEGAKGVRDKGFEREWLALHGEWALQRNRPDEAAKFFRELLQELAPPAAAAVSPATGRDGEEERNGPLVWRAWIGLAQALSLQNSKSALEAYEHARAVLRSNSIAPPWGQGHGSFWGLHDWGTFLEVDLLRRQKREMEALAVARELRVWALLQASRLRRLEQLTPEQRKEWENLIRDYERIRLEWDVVANQKNGVSLNSSTELLRREEVLRRDLLAKAQAVLALLSPEDAVAPGAWGGPVKNLVTQWPPPAAGEVQLHCFPLPEDWTCWVTDIEGSVSRSLAEDTVAPRGVPTGPVPVPASPVSDANAAENQRLTELAGAVARQFVQPTISHKLERAQRLTVAVYGELRVISWSFLLGSVHPHLEVVRILDIPQTESPAGTHTKNVGGTQRQAASEVPRGDTGAQGRADGGIWPDQPRALVVVDPAPAAKWQKTSPEKLGEILRKGFDQRWHLTLISGPGKPVGGAGPGPRASGSETIGARLRSQISNELGQAQRFVYVGPIATSPSTPLTGTGVPLQYRAGMKKQKEQAPGLRVADILTLPRVPEGVVLLGCLGGLGLSEVGGLEDLGLANAFLLRGSRWVIAAVREIHSEIASRLAVALMEAGLAEPAADPGKVLQRAVNALRAKGDLKADQEEELNAFGVFALR